MLFVILPLILVVFAFFYVFRGYAVALLLGLPAFGAIMLASGADNRDFVVGIIFAIVCWFIWVFRKGLKS
jgi:hypothetical protein